MTTVQEYQKYRAFHYKEEKMYDVKNICFEGSAVITLQYNPVIKVGLDSVCLMQSTGIQDKNGVMIFEGDEVIFPFFYSDFQSSHPGMIDFYINEVYYNRGVVKYINGKFVIAFEKPLNYESGLKQDSIDLFFSDLDRECFIESITNIIEEEREKGYSEEEIEDMFDDITILEDYRNETLIYKPEITGSIYTK